LTKAAEISIGLQNRETIRFAAWWITL